jgi:hypothetical protein
MSEIDWSSRGFPGAMPAHYGYELCEPDSKYTLEDYFRGLSKIIMSDDARDKQIGGSHYRKGGEIQPWDIIKAWELDFWEGNVVKYVLRWKHKDGVQDLKKARHYLDYLIEQGEAGELKTKGDIDECGK